MTDTVRGLRGATTVDSDVTEQVTERVTELVREMIARNGIDLDDIVSVIFTATEDIVSMFPATAARGAGLGDVPLICARELSVIGSMPRCIRVLMHIRTDRQRSELHHVYLNDAKGLREDLPG